MSTGGALSIWWLLVPAAILVALLVMLFLLSGRRIGFLALLSLLGGIVLASVWIASSRYRLYSAICHYQMGPNYVDDQTVLVLTAIKGTVALGHETIRNARPDWEDDARQLSRVRPAIYWGASSGHPGDAWVPLSSWKGHPPAWAYLFDGWYKPEKPVVFRGEYHFGVAIYFQLGILVPPLCVFPAIWLVRALSRRRNTKRGLCPNCLYDLRAHKPGDKCPECGTPVPAANATNAPAVHR